MKSVVFMKNILTYMQTSLQNNLMYIPVDFMAMLHL